MVRYVFPILFSILLAGATIYVKDRRAHRAVAAPAQSEMAVAEVAPEGDMEAIIFAAADQYGVPRTIAHAVLQQESGGDPTSTSNVGAAGLMQVMPATAAGIAVDLGISSYDIYDPQTNAMFGMYYLSEKIKRYGVPWGLAAYNWGPSRVDSFLEHHPEAAGMDWPAVLACCADELPGETQGYVTNILAMAAEAAPQAAPAGDPIRQQLVETALSQMGKGYILGAAGPDHFDCSGLMQWTYAQFGMDISRTTFTQLEAPQLRVISPEQIQTGDMIYFQFPSDQHVGMLADLDGDGRWDMVQSGGTRSDVNTVSDVLNDPVYNNNIIGYRSAF